MKGFTHIYSIKFINTSNYSFFLSVSSLWPIDWVFTLSGVDMTHQVYLKKNRYTAIKSLDDQDGYLSEWPLPIRCHLMRENKTTYSCYAPKIGESRSRSLTSSSPRQSEVWALSVNLLYIFFLAIEFKIE